MSISRIKELRKERKTLIDKYTKELETIRNDDRYTPVIKPRKSRRLNKSYQTLETDMIGKLGN